MLPFHYDTLLKVKLEPAVQVGRDLLYPVPTDLHRLLQAIRHHGSLVLAARDVGISYREATRLLERWEAITGHSLAVLTRGKGTGLTAFGTRLAGVVEWLQPQLDAAFVEVERQLEHYLDGSSDASHRPQVVIHASNDVALLKLKERLDRHLAINLLFEGSLNSLDALAASNCDIAGFHVPDPPWLLGPLLEEFSARLNAREHFVVCLYSRFQGLMYAKDRTPRVRSLADVMRRGLRFVNRERGSGTRLLFDALLAREGLPPRDIVGYDYEEFTHMATARAVRNGTADVTFGIEATARVHDLAFRRLVTEHYYLACRRTTSARIAIDTIIANARSATFARAAARIGGYDLTATGSQRHLEEILGLSNDSRLDTAHASLQSDGAPRTV